jgi:sigma-B regulation protein RsbU (phosphoserine phosphatase)
MATRRPAYASYALLAAALAVALAYQARATLDVVDTLRRPTARARVPLGLRSASATLTRVAPEAEAAGLRVGDELVAVAGRAFDGHAVLARAVAATPPGASLALRVRRGDGSLHEASVSLAQERDSGLGAGEWLLGIVVGLAMPLLCLGVGFLVAFLRPRDPMAWLLLALLLSFVPFAGARLLEWPDGLRPLAIAYDEALRSTWYLWLFLFGLSFPDRFPFERRRPWLRWLLVLPLAAGAAAEMAIGVLDAEAWRRAAPIRALYAPWSGLMLPLRMSAIGLYFASIGAKMGMTRERDARRRLLLLNLGTHLSMLPLFVLVLVTLSRTGSPDFGGMKAAWVVPALLMLFLFPATLAYVIVVQRALDVRVVVRLGVQYALARGGVRVLQVLASAAVVFVASTLAIDPEANRPQKIRAIGLAIAIVFLLQRFAVRLAAWIDRRFFREAYDAERILSELAEEVRTMVESGPLLERVSRSIADSLHVPRVAVLTRVEGAYRPTRALGYAALPEAAFADGDGTLRRLGEEKGPLRVYLDAEDSWLQRDGVRPEERAALRSLGTELLLPLAVKDELLGFLSLGSKRSEEPYSGADLRLLRSVATQTGLALENSRLTEAIAREVAQRERHNRELEIAREVQQQLFPQSLPEVPGLDYCGACRPALGVGGDYYDFLALGGGRFGLAIGDVSGKGISAALLMASLQASLRGQTLHHESDLAAIISDVNRLLYEASAANRYATFFYAQYDPQTRELVYVNAGHNAPMLFRGDELLRLDEGGAVVGMLPAFPYAQARVPLRAGDLLVAFTDGVSEAMSTADEEWGEARLIEAARRCRERRAGEILESLMREADAFAAGAKQHDDMTLVVARVL